MVDGMYLARWMIMVWWCGSTNCLPRKGRGISLICLIFNSSNVTIRFQKFVNSTDNTKFVGCFFPWMSDSGFAILRWIFKTVWIGFGGLELWKWQNQLQNRWENNKDFDLLLCTMLLQNAIFSLAFWKWWTHFVCRVPIVIIREGTVIRLGNKGLFQMIQIWHDTN